MISSLLFRGVVPVAGCSADGFCLRWSGSGSGSHLIAAGTAIAAPVARSVCKVKVYCRANASEGEGPKTELALPTTKDLLRSSVKTIAGSLPDRVQIPRGPLDTNPAYARMLEQFTLELELLGYTPGPAMPYSQFWMLTGHGPQVTHEDYTADSACPTHSSKYLTVTSTTEWTRDLQQKLTFEGSLSLQLCQMDAGRGLGPQLYVRVENATASLAGVAGSKQAFYIVSELESSLFRDVLNNFVAQGGGGKSLSTLEADLKRALQQGFLTEQMVIDSLYGSRRDKRWMPSAWRAGCWDEYNEISMCHADATGPIFFAMPADDLSNIKLEASMTCSFDELQDSTAAKVWLYHDRLEQRHMALGQWTLEGQQ
ncbi:hypothetical protein WJX73_001879 [Symbiochloris irregularis]|uniref:Uncharacterized protein n=1 Tax=Symbiochloris irregularis TaxID=706552 RepID=A0AAW1NLH4_9CHLO